MAVDEDAGKWIQKQILGQGAFGCITLWQNDKTEAKIAIKTCRHKDDLPDKTSERWRMEVYIMGRLNHDNVIRSVELPDQLKPKHGDLPILAMEYCEGGDLRKVLNRPENCCGLKESEIRQLVTGIGSAIEYLHSNRIIHRDLKPENIVLKPTDSKVVLYKIIDLGYAKELDVNSICNSYVGTMQYLAPELFVSKPYTKTVDYWSFGSLVFECIAGYRPFLPSLPPVEWHNVVCKKSPDDITATIDENKEVKFSKKLPPNQLCRLLESYLEQWLRLMLRWDPKTRGGGIVQNGDVERPRCFCLLEKIVELKILRILNVETNVVLSYPVDDTYTMQEIQKAISYETEIPPEKQYIILATGQQLRDEDLAMNACFDSASDDLVVFLYKLGPLSLQSTFSKKLPNPVLAIVKEPNTLLPAREQRKTWAQAVRWFTEITSDYKRLVSAHRAAQLNLIKNFTNIKSLNREVSGELGKLMACKDFFQNSLKLDLQQYQNILHNDIHSRGIFLQWTQMASSIDVYNNLRERVDILETKIKDVFIDISELQRKPDMGKELDDLEAKSKNLYGRLLQITQGNGSFESLDYQSMADIVTKCFIKRDELTKVLYKHLSKILECLENLQPILPELETASNEISAASIQLKSMQCRRQNDLWNLLAHHVNSSAHDASAIVPSGVGRFNQETMDYSIYNGQNLESIRLMDDNKACTQRLQDLVDSVVKEQEECLKYISTLDVSS